MTKVFLSYDREDLATARKLAAALERSGHSVWWDRHIKGGSQYADEIEKALDAAEAIVVLWSKHSIASAWVRDEAAAGRDSGRLVPLSLGDCVPPLGFRQYQTLQLTSLSKPSSDPVFDELNETLVAMGSGSAAVPHDEFRPRRHAAPISRRRALLAGGAVTAVAAAGGGYWLYDRGQRSDVPKEVEPLMLQAKQLMNQNTRDGQYMALGLYQRVVQIAPDWADGWGWLGYTYGVISHFRERTESVSLRARAEAAGHRALQIDSKSAFGELALATALPFIGFYAERDRRMTRALSLRPDEDEILIMTGVALQMVGRSTEAIPLYEKVRRNRPFTAGEYYNLIVALWNAGRLPELDEAINDAASLYPNQVNIWWARVGLAMYAGQLDALNAILADKRSWPSGVPEEQTKSFVNVTRAIQLKDPAQVRAATDEQLKFGRLSAQQAELVIRTVTALGSLDDAFALIDDYYFGRRTVIPDSPVQGSGFSPEQRQTRILFQPVTKPLRTDRRFEPLVRELGLDQYWRESGKPPDYRHIAGL